MLKGALEPAAASSSASSIGSALLGNVATSRIISSKEVNHSCILPHTGDDAESNVVQVQLSPAELRQKLGGTFNGVTIDPTRAILSGLHVEVVNDSQYKVNIAIPGYVENDCHSFGGEKAVSGAMHVLAGKSRSENLLADEAVVQDRSITSLRTFSADQLKDCEYYTPANKWRVYAKMQVGNQYITNPVLAQMNAAGVIDPQMWSSIESMAAGEELSNIEKKTYDQYKNGLVAHSDNISSRLTDLTQLKIYVKRADHLNFSQLPKKIAKMSGEHRAEAEAKFRNVPGEVHLRLRFEFASDSAA